ncbi:protein tesmin/TSO1-like CXC 3 isoform X1 [Ziziphus jujuba]|uniref:Protein tesmin/TSO1-like CXC 3 isoform X1 n=1 Tax=Ziziphus jujuba TaxID=326968 RepID=A0A6P3ZP53_ZIZJJ|nr:protein tesmin/TSO1-like CXC 3 isoform X1 [Ziziphus jujuba]
MDTPVKNQLSPATPFSSKFEDSPVFNFISNLSPIEPVKTRLNDHTFNSVNFSSPPSLFASPQISSFSETRFAIRRHHFSDPTKPDSSRSENENNTSEGVSVAVQPSNLRTEQLGYISPGSSAREVIDEPLTDNLELAIELPSSFKYDSGSPSSSVLPCDAINTDSVSDTTNTQAQLVQSVTVNSKERHILFEREKYLRRINRVEQNNEAARHDWEKKISDTDNLFNFDSPVTGEQPEGPDPRTVDTGSMSFISDVLEDDLNKFERPESTDPVGSCEHYVMGEPCKESKGTGDMKETDQTPAVLSSTLMDKLVVNDSNDMVDDKRRKGIQSSCKPRPQLHRTIRRRCLDFERAGSHEKKSSCECSGSSAVAIQSNSKVASVQNKFVHSMGGSFRSSSKLPGVGLHLNSLATPTEGKVVDNESWASESQRISKRVSIRSCDSLIPRETSHDKFSPKRSLERDLVPYDNEGQAIEEAHQTSTYVDEEFDSSSPQNKRRKSEHVVENLACKRCNCKRSKCLKLYCECFAAGLYCVGSCSCIDCLNNPIHENTVLETRRQIESRNPLAFAPKVIKSTDAVAEFGDETNKTPASARHKRGCNCRKSSCLKKYCECFQGGVGCSVSCRCIGCKNTFGRKDGECLSVGAEETEFKESKVETLGEKNATDVETVGEPDLLKTPSEIGRPPYQQPVTLRGKPSPSPQLFNRQNPEKSKVLCGQLKFETRFEVIPEDEALEKMESISQETSGLKSGSPDSKWVSPPHGHGESGSSLNCWRGGRKLILRSIPPFPNFNPPSHH